MSISKRGGHTPVGDDAPLGDNKSVSDQFNRFEVGIGAPADDVGSPGFEVGIGAPTDDVVPAGDVPADDGTSSGDAGDSLLGLGTWESIPELTIADDNDGPINQKGGGATGDPTAANPASGNIGTLLTLGTNPDGSHFFTGNRNVDATLIGSKWGTTTLTYSFPTSGSNYNGISYDSNGVSLYHLDLGTQQQAAARAAFAQLAAVSGLTFTEITETDTVHANIRISQTADQDAPSAYGGFPSDTRPVAGDIWFGRTSQPFYDLAFQGTWGFATMMHEIGHTMGLKHGHQDYTNSDLSGFFGTAPRFGTQSLTPDRDGQAWSLMTYTPAPFTNGNFAGEKFNQPQTYMQYDLAALQYLYGANFNTNSGDSVYTFSQTTGEMFINGVGQGAPAGNKIFLTIWDGGGNDTIDASNYANGVTIDLRPGEFSTFDQAQLANNLAYQNLVNLAPGNIAMSLLYNNDARSLIENATGGVGNDVFVGNTANNILDGGAGSDGVVFTSTTGVTVTLNDTNTDVIVTHDGETDTLRSIENIGGTIGNDTITGNSQDNVLTGGMGGADVLSGGDGNDRLVGGGFTTTTTFSAPSQPDITKPQATNNGSIATAVATAGFFDVDANPDITNATSIPHATINATAFGGSVEYYRIDVTLAGSTAIFDIDGGGTLDDSIIELVNSGNTVLASNDTGTGDVSFPGHDDAYLTFTFNTVGTFYIRVGRFINPSSAAQPMLAGQTYQLNISLQNAAVVTTTVTANNSSSLVADGGEGNDVVLGTIASDTLAGGNGNDTASFLNAFSGGSTTGVTVDLNLQGAAQNTVAAGNDTLTGFENLVGSALDDTLTGDGNDNFIEGGLGNDTLVGGLGNDTASYAGATAGATVSLALQGSAQNTVNAGTDTLSGFENLLGSGFNDNLTGDANANTLTGGAGDDTLNPGGNAGGVLDLLDGGIGTDTASFAAFSSAVTATLSGAADGFAFVGAGLIASLRSIENLIGGANADTLTGDGNANSIEGGLGNDTLNGGLGVDTLAFSGSTAVTVNLATLTAQNTGWGSDTISNFENVRTGSGADNVTGDGNDNIFFDGGGNDTYSGAAGSDTVDYSAATSTVTVNLNTVTAQNTGTSGGSDTITNIENAIGAASFSNTLTGNTLVNRLTGGAAADTVQGNNGADVIFGNAGNDVLLGGTTGALDDGSADTLEGGLGSDYLSGGQGNDILRGGDGNDTLVGGVGNTASQYFTGVDAGDDTYDGGDGIDTAIAVYDGRIGVGASIVGIAFDLRSLAGSSAITFNGVNVGSMTSIEALIFRGTNVNDNVGGTGSFDQLTGGAGDDVLDGWYGNDLLDGGLGNDILIGGEGLDTATYVNSTAAVNVDLRILVAQNTGGQGIDTLSGIEYLTGSAFGDTLRGDDDFNLIIDAGVGAGATALSQTDSLFGYGGNDNILVTRGTPAAAVATNINMDGGDGEDFIELRGGTLSVALAVNAAGLSALGTTQGNVTYLVAGATSNDRNIDVVTVDAGAGSDRIILTGVASATINAGSGADLVSISMRGATSVNNYQLTLGAGADIIQLGVGSNAANSTDVAVTARTSRVTDFQIGDAGDKFELSNFLNFGLTGYTANSNAFASGHLRLTQSGSDLLVQTDRDAGGVTNVFVTVFAISNGYTGGFTAFNFDGFIGNLTLTGIGVLNETLTGATGNDVLSGADGTDALIGLAGNDTLSGGNGDDTLTGGAGNDSLFGGSNLGDAGYDSAVFSGNFSDYQVNFVSPGVVQVIDLRSGSPDGTDTLSGIERIAFADEDYSVDPNTGVLTEITAPPVAVDDVNSAIEDGPVVNGSVATNDSDPDPGETATLTYALNGTVAGLSIGSNGSYSFDPSNAAYQSLAVGVTANVVATYTVTDENGATDTGTLTITITGTNDLPVVTGPVMAGATEGGGVYFFNPLANASDPDAGDGLVVIPVGPLPAGVSFVGGSAATISFSDYALGSVVGQHGWTDGSPGSPDNEIVDVSGNRMLRLANDPTSGDFAGPFSPAFAISAGEASAPADTLSFSFVIKAVNGTADGSRLEIDLGSSDRDDRYNFMAIEYTAGGLRLVQNTPTRTADVWQSDNFDWGGNVQLALLDASIAHTIQVIFRAVDGSNNDIVEYYVDGVLVGTGSTFENFAEFHASQPHASAINSVDNVLFRAADPAGNPFPADGPGGNRQGFYIDDLAMAAYDSHQLQFDANDPAYDHLAAGVTQLVTVNYNVADGHGGVTPTSTVITVTGTNDGATIGGVATGAAVESGVGPGSTPFPGTPSVTGMLTISDVDDGEAELVPVVAGAGVYGTFDVAANGGWTYTLNNADGDTNALAFGASATDSITVYSEDGTASQVITVTIAGTNDAPDALDDTASAIEDGAVVLGSVAGNDSDVDTGATRSWSLVAPVAGLTLDSAGNYVFNPLDPAYQHIAAGATQTIVASYRVTDEHGATDVATLTITVAGANDAPDASNDVNSAAEDGAIVTGNVGSNDTDVDDGATRTFALVAAPPAGLTFNPDGSYSFNPSNAAYQHLAVGATDTLVIGYTVSDGSATDTATLTITVHGTNDAPIAADDINTAIEDGAIVTGTVATGDTDVDDGATRTYALSGSVAGLTINPNGSYSFDPASYDSIAAGDTQIVTATYIVTDDQGAADTGTLTITVTGVNDAPDAVNDTASAVEDGALATGTVAGNDTDVDIGDTRTYTLNAPVAGLSLASDGSYIFNPANAAYQHIALGATATVVATYTLADNHGGSDTATLTFTVIGTNDVPDAVADTIVATEDGVTVSGNLGVNDTDADDGATRTYLLVAPITGLTLTPSGNYTFDPSSYDSIAAGSSVTLSSSYRVIDNNGATDTATITITIHGINDAPDAVNDVATAIEDGAIVTGNVSFNDIDADSGDSRTYAQFGAVAGLTINSDGSYSFNPSDVAYQHIRLGATEVVVATYTMTDDAGVTDTATLTITVSGRNDAPLALFDLATASEDGGIVIGNVGDNDVDADDGAARSFIPAGPVPAGLTFNPDGSYIFDPSNAAYQHLAAGVTQAVLLSYRITDQHGATGTSTLTITVTGTNDGPIAADDVDSAVEDGAVVTGNVGAGDTDVDDGATRTYALNGIVPGLTIAANGDYSFDPSNAAYQHLAQGATDIIVATYTVSDQFGATDTATLTITITGANDAPVALDDNRAVNEDGGTITGNVGGNDTDVDDGATHSFAAAGPLPAGLSFGADGSYSFDPSDAAYQHLAQGVTELVTLSYTISDGLGGTDNATLTITVTGTNDAPAATDDVVAATEDGAVVTGNVGANDADVDAGATRTYALVGPAPAGLTFNPNGSYSFDPASYDSIAAGATQIVTVTYTAADQLGATDTATLTITVNGINDAPDAVNDIAGAVEDGAVLTGNVGANDTEVDIGDARTYSLVAPAPAGLTFNADGSYAFNPLDPAYQHLAAGATQIVAITYTLADNHGGSDSATLTITVTGTNDAPVAADDVNSAIESGAVVTGNVGANDGDIDDGATRSYALVGPALAGLTFNANGSYSFNPANVAYQSLASGATQTVVATYIVTDGEGATDTATLTITVTGVSHAPDAVNDIAGATEDGAVVTGTVATNDTDADVGDTRTYTLNAPVAGLTLNSNGSYSFDPASYDSLALGATQIVVATYTLTDGEGATDTATLTITVTGVNDLPDAVNDIAGATEDGAIVAGTVAANDTDVDVGDTRTYTLNAPVAGLVLDSSGSYSFDPSSYDSLAAGATQIVVATYTMTDGQGATDTATLTITVTGIDDAAVAQPDSFTINEATILSGSVFANNGSGADADVDGPALSVAAVNGSGANVGVQIALSSGALLTLNADGTFTYNPNHAFDATPTPGSGASNTPGHDVFTYALSGGATATVNVTLTGLDTNDILLGTSGADVLAGGNGDDTYYVENAGDVVIEAIGGGDDRVIASVSYALGNTGVETLEAVSGTASINLFGNGLANTIRGNSGSNTLIGGEGADILIGGAGNDYYRVEEAGDAVVESVGGGFDFVYAVGNYTLTAGSEVELLSAIDPASTAALVLTGNEFANIIYGNAGSNTLIGGGAADTLIGGGGNDFYRAEEAGDVVVESVGGGFDSVYAVGSYTLAAGSEVELLSAIDPASTAEIVLIGNEFANWIYGNAGVNVLIGDGGADTLIGGAGNDFYRVEQAGDVVVEAVGGGSDAVYAVGSYTLGAGSEVELLSAIDPSSTTGTTLIGNEFANTLIGTAGADTLIGGGGNDALSGGAGNDAYRVEDAGDMILEYASGGSDAVYAVGSYTLQGGYEIEVLAAINPGSTAAQNLTGNEQSNTIFGSAGANILDGKGGNDTMVGGAGADVFAFTSALGAGNVDTITDFLAGTDKIGLDDAIFTAIGGTLNANAFVIGSAAADADDRIIYNQAAGQLFYDADGSGGGAAVLFATLNPGLALTVSDFQMI